MPNADDRLLRTLVRKQLDQILDLLDSLDEAQRMGAGVYLSVPTANHTFHLALRITRLGQQQTLPFEPQDPDAQVKRSVPAPAPEEAKLKRIHEKLLEKASLLEPIPAKKLIALAGYKNNSYAWEAITLLARRRLLIRTPDGYLRAS